MKSRNYKKIIITAVAVVLVISGIIFLDILADYMQLMEIGNNFTAVFWRNLEVNVITFAVCALLAFTVFVINFKALSVNLKRIGPQFSYLEKFLPFVIIGIVAGLISGVAGMRAISDKILPFLTSETFGLEDPVFSKDIGYYVFQRPFYTTLLSMVNSYLGFIIVSTLILYLVMYARYNVTNIKTLFKEKGVSFHIVILVILYFALHIFSYRLSAESLLFNTDKTFVGASYTDINIRKVFYTYAPYFLVAVAILTLVFIRKSKFVSAVITVASYPLSILAVHIVAIVVQAVVVAPNELSMEQQYISHNINFTRKAYNLEKITEYDFYVAHDLDSQKIMNNIDTIDNIRLTDFTQTLNILNQVQTIKNYYTFTDSDMALYKIDGRDTVVSIGARELDKDLIPDTGKNYINTKMKYTHGMGVAMNPVNVITDEGQPHFIIRDIPPKSVDGAPFIKQPRIYYGEKTNDYVIVNTKDKELDEIQTGGYSYKGTAGIKLTWNNRLLYSLKYTDFKLLVSSQITNESKLLINRNILERARKAAPFLDFDQDPVILVDGNGELKWVIDAYTKSGNFPYAEYYEEDANYIRNSVKVIIDAYDGDVKFYIIDKTDPIIKSYSRIYPSLFEVGDFPEDLAEHIRYPEKMFKIQASMLKKYHITDASDFYQKHGMWAFTKEKYDGESTSETEPYYTMMKLDGDKPEFVLMIPYTLSGRDNMIAWLAVRCEKERYGEMVLYNFDRNKNVYGIYQIENKIDTDAEISKDLSLWSQGGSTVIRGNMMVIPIDNNILYVEPVFISSGLENQTLPEIKKIVVAYNETIESAPTLNGALQKLFGISRPKVEINEEEITVDDIINEVVIRYDNVKKATEEGSWEGYGTSMAELENSINELKEYIEEKNKDKPIEATTEKTE